MNLVMLLEMAAETYPDRVAVKSGGESLTYAADGRALYTSSEGSNPPLNRWACVD